MITGMAENSSEGLIRQTAIEIQRYLVPRIGDFVDTWSDLHRGQGLSIVVDLEIGGPNPFLDPDKPWGPVLLCLCDYNYDECFPEEGSVRPGDSLEPTRLARSKKAVEFPVRIPGVSIRPCATMIALPDQLAGHGVRLRRAQAE